MSNWLIDIAEKDYESKLYHNAFGVLIYTHANASMRKIIEDNAYWDALDDRSGKKWKIYCIKAAQRVIELPVMPEGYMGMMIPVWKEPSENKKLLELFGIRDTKEAYFVFFNFDEDKTILYRKYQIKETNI